MLGPKLYDKCPSGTIPKPGKDAIDSIVDVDLHAYPLKVVAGARLLSDTSWTSIDVHCTSAHRVHWTGLVAVHSVHHHLQGCPSLGCTAVFTTGIYRAVGKDGEAKPASVSFLQRWLGEAREAGML